MGGYPTWSPDSRQFAYVAFRGPRRVGIENPIRVHTVAGGEERVLFSGVQHTVVNGTIGNCVWASSQPTIYCGVFQTAVNTKVISIATDTGRMAEVGTLNGFRFFDRLSPDDRTLISVLKGGPRARTTVAHRWEIGTSREKETSFAAVVDSNITESPDGRWVYRVVTDSSNRREYQIRPTSGSDSSWRHLMYVNRPALIGGLSVPVTLHA